VVDNGLCGTEEVITPLSAKGWMAASWLRQVVVNPGNGCAGPITDLLEKHLPYRFIKVNNEPDGTFPNGIPNPLLPENREATACIVVADRPLSIS